jgi:hypothetical protein
VRFELLPKKKSQGNATLETNWLRWSLDLGETFLKKEIKTIAKCLAKNKNPLLKFFWFALPPSKKPLQNPIAVCTRIDRICKKKPKIAFREDG